MLILSGDIFGLLFGVLFAVAAVFSLCYFLTDKDSEGELFKSYMEIESAALDKNVDLDTIKKHVTDMLSLLAKFETSDDDQRREVNAYMAYLQVVSNMDSVSDIQVMIGNYCLPEWMIIYPRKEERFAKLKIFFLVMIVLSLVAVIYTFVVWVVILYNNYDLYYHYYLNDVFSRDYIDPSRYYHFWN